MVVEGGGRPGFLAPLHRWRATPAPHPRLAIPIPLEGDTGHFKKGIPARTEGSDPRVTLVTALRMRPDDVPRQLDRERGRFNSGSFREHLGTS